MPEDLKERERGSDIAISVHSLSVGPGVSVFRSKYE